MFGIGTAEILIILLIALIVLGPSEIPKIARTLGRGMREIERAKDELKKTIEFEEDLYEAKKKESRQKNSTSRDEPESPEGIDDLPSRHI